MTRRAPPRLGFSSSARLAGLRVTLPFCRETLNERLEQWGPLRALPLEDFASGQHPVCLELWRVTDGRLELGGADQHAWLASLATAQGALAERLLGVRRGSLARSLGQTGRSLSQLAARALGNYHEALVSIPCVQRGAAGETHTLVLGMLTDSWVARWGDAALGFGYHKQPARFDTDGASRWSVFADGQALLHVDVQLTTRALAAEIAGVDAIWREPLLGGLGSERWAASRLERSLQARGVCANPIDGTVELGRDLSIGPGRGRYRLSEQATLSRWGSFHFSGVTAKLSYPWPIRQPRAERLP